MSYVGDTKSYVGDIISYVGLSGWHCGIKTSSHPFGRGKALREKH